MYICSTEEVVTDKGCGHRLPPWLVFSWIPFRLLTPTRHPLPEARSAHECLFAAQLPAHACMCSTGWLQGWQLRGLPPQ